MTETVLDDRMTFSVAGKVKTLAIIVTTVGEKKTIPCLKRFLATTTVKHKMIAWYNCIQPFDGFFFNELRELTDDVIVCTKNKGILEAFGFSLLYLDSDYVVLSSCDTMMREGWLDRYMRAFEIYPTAACAGQSWDNKVDYKLWTPSRYCPDRATMWSKTAINKLGSISPSFKTFGDGETELFYRAAHKGFPVVEVKDIVDDFAWTHEGSALLSNKQELVDRNIRTLYRASYSNFKGYDWWTNDI